MLIKAIYESFCRAIIRFFDGLFIRSDEVQFLRMELEKTNQAMQRMIESITVPKITAEVINDEDFKPVTKGYQSWSAKRLQLERESFERAQRLASEARTNLERAKTTEELESELLGEAI